MNLMIFYEWVPCLSPADSDSPAVRPFCDRVIEYVFVENALKAKKQLVERERQKLGVTEVEVYGRDEMLGF